MIHGKLAISRWESEQPSMAKHTHQVGREALVCGREVRGQGPQSPSACSDMGLRRGEMDGGRTELPRGTVESADTRRTEPQDPATALPLRKQSNSARSRPSSDNTLLCVCHTTIIMTTVTASYELGTGLSSLHGLSHLIMRKVWCLFPFYRRGNESLTVRKLP